MRPRSREGRGGALLFSLCSGWTSRPVSAPPPPPPQRLPLRALPGSSLSLLFSRCCAFLLPPACALLLRQCRPSLSQSTTPTSDVCCSRPPPPPTRRIPLPQRAQVPPRAARSPRERPGRPHRQPSRPGRRRRVDCCLRRLAAADVAAAVPAAAAGCGGGLTPNGGGHCYMRRTARLPHTGRPVPSSPSQRACWSPLPSGFAAVPELLAVAGVLAFLCATQAVRHCACIMLEQPPGHQTLFRSMGSDGRLVRSVFSCCHYRCL